MMFLPLGCFLPRTAFLLLLLFFFFSSFGPTQTEVVRSISDCADFLLNQSPPQIPNILEDGKILNQNRYKPICQTYRNTRTFLTLYDTKERIPVFSAIKFGQDKIPGKRPKSPKWMIEPQLEDESADKNMKRDKNMEIDNKKEGTYEYQASNLDYQNSEPYNRGHLCPSSYASNKTTKTSTFTLTNIVPQVKSFNRGSWAKMEKCVKCFMEKFCNNSNGVTEGYVVTGAQPGDKYLNERVVVTGEQRGTKKLNRVNIPSLLWSAFCCYSVGHRGWLASAHWGENVADKSQDEYLKTKSLNDLYKDLNDLYKDLKVPTFNIFPGTKCPPDMDVSMFYPELHKSCKCPPY
uniref:Endonuclease domain-containing 1 protein-like n=1 Tax=Oryzias latipes TaxID=8090 RepID=A0A3P9IBZ5_ORYLA